MVRASGRSRSVPTSVSPGPTSAARDMLTLETLRSPGSHGTTCSQFSSYSFLGYLSSISDAGSCPSSWPPDAGRLQGFDEAPPSLFSLHVREPIQLQLPYGGCGLPTASAAQGSPLSSRPLDRYGWVPSRPHKWSRSQRVFDSVFPSHTGASTHTHEHFFLWISPFTKSTAVHLVTNANVPEPSLRPPSPHPLGNRAPSSVYASL